MAKETNIERTYTVPLRREFLKAVPKKRANRAVKAVRQFLEKHMKSDKIKLDDSINLEIWKHGISNPPSKVKINATKDANAEVRATLFGVKKEEPKAEPKSAGKEKLSEKVKAPAVEAPAEQEVQKTETAEPKAVEKEPESVEQSEATEEKTVGEADTAEKESEELSEEASEKPTEESVEEEKTEESSKK